MLTGSHTITKSLIEHSPVFRRIVKPDSYIGKCIIHLYSTGNRVKRLHFQVIDATIPHERGIPGQVEKCKGIASAFGAIDAMTETMIAMRKASKLQMATGT